MPYVDTMYITEVDHEFEGDAFFPEFPEEAFTIDSVVDGAVDEKEQISSSFCYPSQKGILMSERMFAIIGSELNVKPKQVQAAVELLDEGNTVPFIARYRKEVTGELQDEQLRTIEERIKYLRNLETRRQEIIASITEQEKMTDELMKSFRGRHKASRIRGFVFTISS